MTIFQLLLIIFLTKIIKYIILVRSSQLICCIVRFCNLIDLEFIAKNVKNINFTFLQICKKKLKPLNHIYIIYFMLYSNKMTTNMRNTVIFEGKHFSEELKPSKKRLIKMFENLKTKVHKANENGLTSLLKI